MKLKVGKKVLVTNLSLMYSDYRNIDGKIVDVDGDFVKVAVKKNSFYAEDEKELRKDGNNVIVRVKTSNIA